jgi:hypothetical protein
VRAAHRLNAAPYPRPYPDETLSSWIERIAIFYGGELHAWAADLLVQVGDFFSPEHQDLDCSERVRRLLHRMTGMALDELPSVLPGSAPLTLSRWHRVAFCPQCWDDDIAAGRQPFIRGQWALWHQVWCARHHQLLCMRNVSAFHLKWDNASWAPLWQARANWAQAFELPLGELGRDETLWTDFSRLAGYSPEQFCELSTDLARFAPTSFGRASSLGHDARAKRIVGLVLWTRFTHVPATVRKYLLQRAGQAVIPQRQWERHTWQGKPRWPRLLQNRIALLVTAAELLRLVEHRAAIAEDVRATMLGAFLEMPANQWRSLRLHMRDWPVDDVENFVEHLPEPRLTKYAQISRALGVFETRTASQGF